VNRLTMLLASTIITAGPAWAQSDQEQATRQPEAPAPAPQRLHGQAEDIIVTAPFVRELNILAGTSVLSGAELQREVRPQIGDTLARLPGVSATSFTPGSSRPVIRGFQGERVRVLTDGIGSIDVSNTSADHAVTIDPLTADRVEVLRGPAVLLFGSQASGGAVNVLDRRIPREVPEHGYHVDVIGLYGSVADERSVGAAADLSLGGGLVFHLNGSWRKTDDLRAGGYVLSPRLRAEQFEIAEEELEEGHVEEAEEALELANLRGRIPNSDVEQKTASAGLALIRDNFNIGASISRFESDYGVPMRPGAAHHHDHHDDDDHDDHHDDHHDDDHHGHEGSVRIGLKQTRYDMRGEYQLAAGFLDRIRLRLGAANYRHTEFEGGEVGTVFRSKGAEGRLELVQRDQAGWRGASGLQYFRRNFSAVGAEAFVPPNKTDQFGIFTLQELDLGSVDLEGSARFEHSDVRTRDLGLTRRFDAFSLAAGAGYEIAPRMRVGLNLSRTERAPSAEELFADGPHIATQAFEIGDPDMKKERSWGAEAYVRAERSDINFSATLFANRIDNFIYLAATGEEEDELPVFEHRQRGARFVGFEAEASAPLFTAGGFRFVADAVADYVRATIRGAGPVPRIPPLRLLGGIGAQSDRLDGRVEVEWVARQNRVAEFENPTGSHTLVNASLGWKPWGRANESVLMLSANNIFDVDARRHASFTKDFVPLAGRDIRLSARFSF